MSDYDTYQNQTPFVDDRFDWLALLVWIIFVFWQPFSFGTGDDGAGGSYAKRYGAETRQVRGKWGWFGAPPSWLFGVVWSLLYVLIAVAAFIYWRSPYTQPRVSTMVAIVVNLVLNKLWTPLYFSAGLRGAALLVAIAIFGTNVWVEVELFAQAAHAVNAYQCTAFYVAASLWLPYTVWSLYAVFLNSIRVFSAPAKNATGRRAAREYKSARA